MHPRINIKFFHFTHFEDKFDYKKNIENERRKRNTYKKQTEIEVVTK